MKAVVVEKYDAIDNIGLKDVALPEVSSGQVRVKSGCQHRLCPRPQGTGAPIRPKTPCPSRPELSSPALLTKSADDVSGFAGGTPVMGMTRSGALAEYITVPAAAVTAIPDGIAPEVCCRLPRQLLTALYALGERASYAPANSCWSSARPAAPESPRFRSAS